MDRREMWLLLARRMAPGLGDLEKGDQDEYLAIIEEALAAKSPRVQRQVGLFLWVLCWSPLIRFGRSLPSLDPALQDRALKWFEDAPLQLLRSGFWGVRILVFMGIYGRASIHGRLGYRPRRERSGAVDAHP